MIKNIVKEYEEKIETVALFKRAKVLGLEMRRKL